VQTATSTETPKILGPSIASYGPRKRHWREAWIWPLPGFILALVLIVTGLDWYYYGYTQYGPIAAQSWSQDWLLWGILIGVTTLLITVWQVFRTRGRVNLYRYGISTHLPLQPSRSLRWEEITGIASATIQDSLWGHTLRTRHQSTIFPTQGMPITLDNHLGNLLELTTRLKANLYPRLLPGLRTRYQTGHQLNFGPISIHLKSVTIRDRQIPWEQVSHITVLSGHLIVETHDHVSDHSNNIRIPGNQIPNLELLLQVLQRGLNEQL